MNSELAQSISICCIWLGTAVILTRPPWSGRSAYPDRFILSFYSGFTQQVWLVFDSEFLQDSVEVGP